MVLKAFHYGGHWDIGLESSMASIFVDDLICWFKLVFVAAMCSQLFSEVSNYMIGQLSGS